jgi:hypothetical protein
MKCHIVGSPSMSQILTERSMSYPAPETVPTVSGIFWKHLHPMNPTATVSKR